MNAGVEGANPSGATRFSVLISVFVIACLLLLLLLLLFVVFYAIVNFRFLWCRSTHKKHHTLKLNYGSVYTVTCRKCKLVYAEKRS